MLFVNRCTWAHILAEAAHILGLPEEDLLSFQELAALNKETEVVPEIWTGC
jgi:hypothetical protein